MAPVTRPLFAHLLLAFFVLGGAACSGDTEELTGKDAGGSTTCANDDNCPSDQYCAAGMCIPGTGNECTMDSECMAHEMCVIVTQWGGASRCHGNACEPKSCTDDSACPEGYTCGDSHVCVETPDQPCEDNDECTAQNTVCIDGACVPAVACEDSSDCPSDQRCIGDVCDDPCLNND